MPTPRTLAWPGPRSPPRCRQGLQLVWPGVGWGLLWGGGRFWDQTWEVVAQDHRRANRLRTRRFKVVNFTFSEFHLK